jgi:A/G-specific adenine glycosylase
VSSSVSQLLIRWYRKGHRALPWRATSDPYRIWVSEIMLQQTRAQAAIAYYERFLARFPTVEALAAASEDEVLAQWSGLGYYSRARNLRKAAVLAATAGGFPREYEGIRALPGIGDYTAAAVASIAFGLPHAVVDGNVLRVVARVENDASDIGSARTRERFRGVVEGWLDRKDPAHFNQAIMELGATVCLPRNPMCLVCPLAAVCRGREEGTAGQLPVKLRKTQPVALEGVLLIVERDGRVLLRRRDGGESRMAGFWDLPAPEELPKARLGAEVGTFRHTITHHHYTWTVRLARFARGDRGPGAGGRGLAFGWFAPEELRGIPLCTTARKGLRVAGWKES